MKNFTIITFKAAVLALSLMPAIGFCQNTQETIQQPVEEKKKIIKVQCLINGRNAPSNLAFGHRDVDLSIKTFPFYEQDRKERKELVVKEFDVSLVRDGKKIANQTVYGNGSIAYLAAMAHNEDTYLIQIKEVFVKTDEGNLKLYAKGVIKIAYLFYDLDIFKPNVQGNAISANDVK